MSISNHQPIISHFRSIFNHEEETNLIWKNSIEQFPNNVPRFYSKQDAIEFTKKHCKIGSNPDELHLHHSITTLIDWKQITTHLIPRINRYNELWLSNKGKTNSHDSDITENNRFLKRFHSNQINNNLTKDNHINDDNNHIDNTTTIMNNNNNNHIDNNKNHNKDSDSEEEIPLPPSDDEEEEIDREGLEGLLYDYITSRLNLSIHKELSNISTLNTLKYMFFHMKCGIYVMIRNNKLVIFCPFVNKDYKNSWNNALKFDSIDGNLDAYYDEKNNHYRKEHIIKNTAEWWANGNIICNEYSNEALGNQYWGDHFLFQLKDMFAELCNQRAVPNCDFFINKRDYPHLKFNEDIGKGIPVEPYGFIFDRDDRDPKQDIPLNRHFYKSYAPILSFYTSKRFADIPIPPSEDWEAATGAVFPSSFIYSLDSQGNIEASNPRDLFTTENLKKFDCTWDEKQPTAFFRGTATGGGVTPETNQRLHLASISYEWSLLVDNNKNSINNGLNGADPLINEGKPYLDAKITGWNLRDKKLYSYPMTHIKPKEFPFSGDRATNFVEIYKQSRYKYLLYVEGHCAACRYGFMMQLGSVILKVDSKCVADQMWYFPLLKPYYDHIPVKADLSDLKDVLEWCHTHDIECQNIAKNAKELYNKYVSREGILDYLQSICIEISKRWIVPPVWCSNPPVSHSIPSIPTNNGRYQMNRYCVESHDKDGEFCSYCIAKRAKEEKQRIESNLNAEKLIDKIKRITATEISGKDQKRKELRDRKKKLAEEEKKKAK